jgi:hypothetical protein
MIIRTTNAGESWITPPCPTSGALAAVCFSGSDVGMAVGEAGTILRTTNGGDHWAYQWSGSRASFTDVCFTDPNNGTIVGVLGGCGVVFRTTDGGNTWGQSTVAGAPELCGVCFPDRNTGWVVGADGWISKTTDGGMSWGRGASGYCQTLRAIHFVDSKTGWAVGDGGTILKSTLGSVTSVEHGQVGGEPTGFALEQNYPNPFNPLTVVDWQLPVAGVVKLSVYDLLGREVAVLVNEWKMSGMHRATFDGSGLASGVYVYRLIVGGFVTSRTMVLSK